VQMLERNNIKKRVKTAEVIYTLLTTYICINYANVVTSCVRKDL